MVTAKKRWTRSRGADDLLAQISVGEVKLLQQVSIYAKTGRPVSSAGCRL